MAEDEIVDVELAEDPADPADEPESKPADWQEDSGLIETLNSLAARLESLEIRLDDPVSWARGLRLLADLACQRVRIPGAKWAAVLVPDTGDSARVEFDTVEELAACLKAHRGEDLRAYPYYGLRLGIARGGQFLLTHEGRYSLVDAVDLDAVDNDGFLGRPAAELKLPESPIGPAPIDDTLDEEYLDERDDEDEDDDEDGG